MSIFEFLDPCESKFEFWDPCVSTFELALVETAASRKTTRTRCIMLQRTRCLGLQMDQPSRIGEKLVLMRVSTRKVAIDRLVIFNQPHLEQPPILYIRLKFRKIYDYRYDVQETKLFLLDTSLLM